MRRAENVADHHPPHGDRVSTREQELERRLRQCIVSMEATCVVLEQHRDVIFDHHHGRLGFIDGMQKIIEWAGEPLNLAHEKRQFVRPHRWPEVWCSQCGVGFGPGNFGYSHCSDHAHWRPQ